MDAAAKVSSKGQVTVPKVVRDALGIVEGDEIVFRVDGRRATRAIIATDSSRSGSGSSRRFNATVMSSTIRNAERHRGHWLA